MVTITDSAERRTRLFADAVADGITLDDECELHGGFLSAALAGDQERCRVMVEDADSRLGAARAARRLAEQEKLPEFQIARLREEFESSLQEASPSFQPVIPAHREWFAKAAVAQDVVRCRALAAVVRDAWNYRTPTEIEAQRQADEQAPKGKVAQVQQDRARQAHLAELRQRCAQG